DHKVGEVRHHSDVCVSFVDTAAEIYISVTGEALVVNNREKAEKHGSLAALAWFEEGVADEDLRLLKVDVRLAEKWDVKANPLEKIWEIMRSQHNPRTPEVTENTKFQSAAGSA
ncbi:MAG TPA: pyridoxamine 5'-phosphate oxidase family protein, partial [Alphaproteobacteria bacterium]|nr:pyridoxamine 5'-phosphate oxidase family protein [Alphaproteobacteria bacterium]